MHPHFLLLALVIGFLGGASIILGPWFEYRGLFIFGLAIVSIYTSLWQSKKLPLLLMFFVGVTLSFWSGEQVRDILDESDVAPKLEEERVSIVDFPNTKSAYQEIHLRRYCREKICRQNILWQAPLGTQYGVGESFLFSCQTERVKNFSEDFDYRMYLAKEGIGFICKKGAVGQRLEPTYFGRWLGIIGRGRILTEETLAKVLPEPELGLARGLILGGNQYLSKDAGENFQRIGMTHIVAVSGYNILLVAGAAFFFLAHVGVWRRQKIFLGSIVVWAFIIFVGAPASAVRAGSMALLFFLALATGRKSSGFAVLLIAAFLMLLYNPLLLFYDVGFQLSFMALVGILCSSFEYGSEKRTWRERLLIALKTTLWVEACILPLIVYHFGALTWFSVIANIVLLPIVPLAMLGTSALLPLGMLLPSALLPIIVVPVYGVLWILIHFAEYFGSFPWIQLEGIKISVTGLFFWYGTLITFAVVQLQKRKRKWYAKAFLVDG